jgi:hypothetical protein
MVLCISFKFLFWVLSSNVMALQLNQKELAQRYASNPSNFFVFLGAGVSISAGMPSAYGLMQELKKRYYCSEENQKIDLCDMSNDGTAQKVQDF